MDGTYKMKDSNALSFSFLFLGGKNLHNLDYTQQPVGLNKEATICKNIFESYLYPIVSSYFKRELN